MTSRYVVAQVIKIFPYLIKVSKLSLFDQENIVKGAVVMAGQHFVDLCCCIVETGRTSSLCKTFVVACDIAHKFSNLFYS